MVIMEYPKWICYPRCIEHPEWVEDVAAIFRKHKSTICSINNHCKSDEVLEIIRQDLESVGFLVEGGNGTSTIKRPVFLVSMESQNCSTKSIPIIR
jgi:hypothetical protein